MATNLTANLIIATSLATIAKALAITRSEITAIKQLGSSYWRTIQ